VTPNQIWHLTTRQLEDIIIRVYVHAMAGESFPLTDEERQAIRTEVEAFLAKEPQFSNV
jgi:dihydrodipicolinate synthase/N-acetylneuraminate lyase